MMYNCPKCKLPMSRAEVGATGGIGIFKKTGRISAKWSNMHCYVCATCGYIEFYAEKPDIFKVDENK